MICLARIVLTMSYVLFFAQLGISQHLPNEIRVVASTFCIELDGSDCARPVVSDSDEVSLSQLLDSPAGIYFWSAIEATEDRNVMHVWSASHRTDKWAEPVHVSLSDRLAHLGRKTYEEIRKTAKEFLSIMYNKADSPLHSVQGIVVEVRQSSQFRTCSRLRAVPGIYSVEVRNLNGQVVPGGKPKTITIRPD